MKLGHIMTAALAVFFFALLMGYMAHRTDVPRDDTDPSNGRSGMHLFIDARTGCHYLGAPGGGITPRYDSGGRPICDQPRAQ